MISEWEAGKFENRRIHSEDLRRVIQDWVLSLPYVNRTDAIPRFHFGPGLYSVFDGGRLAVENDVIFRDLSNHLDHQLLNRWDDLKDAARRFEKQRAGLDARIRMQVVDVFGLNILNRWDTSCVNEQLLKRVESAIFAQAENRDKDFHKYANFDSELVDKPNFFEYYLDHVEAVKVAKQNLPSNAELIEKRIELDEKVSSLMQIDTSTIEKAEKLIKAVKKFEDEGILILRQLEELVRLPTFPGKCRYLSV